MEPRSCASLLAGLFLVPLAVNLGACGGNVIAEPAGGGASKGGGSSSGGGDGGDTISPTCGAAEIECGGACVDPSTDNHNCGGCGIECKSGPDYVPCNNGTCAQPCPPGYAMCDPGLCADLQSDPYNCGSCGNACNSEQSCESGVCTWLDDFPVCLSCSEAIMRPPPPADPICRGTSEELFNALLGCVCQGACTDSCADNVCIGTDITAECQGCVVDTQAGCGNEFNECANDF